MAHNLNYNEHTGKYSFFSVQQNAWHNLGQVVAQYPTSAEAIRHAGMDFEVVKCPLYTKGTALHITQEGEITGDRHIIVPDQYATIRSDNNAVFGVVGKDCQIVQNADAFAFFDGIVGGGDGIQYETAGALGRGNAFLSLPS